MKNTTKAVLLAIVMISIIAIATASAIKPTLYGKPPAMVSGQEFYGSVAGRVTTTNNTGLAYSFVAIVNASNTSQAFYIGQTDSQGAYSITGVNNTWNGSAYLANYKMYANHSQFGEGLSNSFIVEFNSTAPANVIINPLPHTIKIYSERNNIVADGSDSVKVWAYVTDALNNAVSDNTPIILTINNGLPYDPNNNGSWKEGAGQSITQTTVGGYVNATFGYVPETNTLGGGNAGNNSTLMAAYAGDLTINDSTKIFFQPTVVSWFGSVMDSYGKPYGGVTVTLHLMGTLYGVPGSEIYNLTTMALPDQPYPGSYVFDNILMFNNASGVNGLKVEFAYATAQATIQDGVVITGMSNNYSLNKSRTSSGFIVLHVPLPDQIKVTANPETILVGGDISDITAQLYLNGAPYKRDAQIIHFFGNNDTVGFLPAVKTNVTDKNGAAHIQLQSNMTKGIVTVTAYAQVTVVNNLTGSADVKVVGWGTISGMVTDKNKYGVPNATVKLYTTNTTDGNVNNVALYPSPENPQYTVSRPEVAAIGTYTYYRIPSGIYNVTAEKADAAGNNHIWFAIVNLTVGTATNNVAIPTLVYSSGVPTTVTPTPPAVTATPTPTAAPPVTPTPAPGFEMVFALAGLLGVAFLIARKNH